MSRRSFQRVTLSIELTLPPGAKAKDAPKVLKESLRARLDQPGFVASESPWKGLALEQAVIKILKRETIYTN